jgi:hypothetical protein
MPRTGALARHAVEAIHPRRPLPGVVAGAVAGAAGTTVLNTVTYLDMALRGRPSSSAPQEVVEKLADRAGVGIPGSGETKQNRLQGLGPLTGTAVGLAVGVAAGGVHRFLLARGTLLPWPVAGVLLGLSAMALTDSPIAALGVSDPKQWQPADWASDLIPHLAYGLTTSGVIRAFDR